MKFFKQTMMALALAASGSAMASGTVYETGFSNPWGNATNDTAMDGAFGAGNWSKYNGFTMAGFSGAGFVFLDGSDSNSGDLATFLVDNAAGLQAFVSNGGHLFINDAPNTGPASTSLGFGVTMNWNSYADASSVANVTAAGVAAGLTAGGISSSYTGDFFAHSTVSGPISDLVDGSAGTIFGGEQYGNGYVAFGGQTTTNFHFPDGDANMLLVNELKFVSTTTAVPEPANFVLMGIGLLGLGVAARRRRG